MTQINSFVAMQLLMAPAGHHFITGAQSGDTLCNLQIDFVNQPKHTCISSMLAVASAVGITAGGGGVIGFTAS